MAMTSALVYSVPHMRAIVEHDDDADLIARARQGDLDAYRICVERHSRRVYGVAYHMVGNAQDAQDIAQEVFIRLYRTIGQYRAASRFTTWLYRLTINCAIDYQRNQARHRAQSIDDSAEARSMSDDRPLPDAAAEQSELRGAIHRISGRLTARQRSVFVLRDLHGFSIGEIAAILKCRESTVRVHLASARNLIKEALLKHYPELCGGLDR